MAVRFPYHEFMTISDRFKSVSARVSEAAVAAGRNASDVQLIAVSKTHPPEIIREAIAAGASVFGENKVQEGIIKVAEIGNEGVEWHLIGHLQKNKVRKAVQSFDVIHTVDSLKLAKRIDRIAGEDLAKPLRVLAQVDLASEKTKFGIGEGALDELAEYIGGAEHLDFRGLMTIPPFFEDPEDVRPYFAKLREIRDRLSDDGLFSASRGELSMGMSHDFRVAIEEGATMVRVGTAIFGERVYSVL